MNLVLAVLAALRLARFVTTDYLGHWWIVQPARRWALAEYPAYQGVHAQVIDADWAEFDVDTPRQKLVKGLDCPFCVGFWLGAAVLLSLAVVRAVPPLLPLWRFVMGALALNYVVGHVSSRID